MRILPRVIVGETIIELTEDEIRQKPKRMKTQIKSIELWHNGQKDLYVSKRKNKQNNIEA